MSILGSCIVRRLAATAPVLTRRAGFSLLLTLPLLGVSLFIGCGSDPAIHPKGNFTNASLQGNYTYSMSGNTFGQASGNGLFEEAGSFVSDGNGHITGGFDDFVLGSLASNTVSGNYQIAADGTGMINLTIGSRQVVWAVTIASNTQLYLVEFDAAGCAGGAARLQTVAAFGASPVGDFVFRIHNVSLQGSIAKVGSFTVAADGSLTGGADVLRGGNLISPNISGTITASDNNGRGTLTVTEDTGVVANYNFYVIDSTTLNLIQVDTSSLGEGRVEKRSTSSFSNSSLQSAYVFRSVGDTPLNIGGANSLGTATSDGNGSIRTGTLDSLQDGNPISNAQVVGSYSVDSRGRATITLNPQGFNPVEQVAWLVDDTHGYYLVNSSDRVEDGRLDLQQVGSSGTLSPMGAFGFYMSGYDNQSPPLVAKLGVVTFDGQQTVTFADYYVNRSGLRSQKGNLSGTYSVGPNGRFTATIPGVTKTLIGYLITPNIGYLMVGDAGAEEPGRMEQPPSP